MNGALKELREMLETTFAWVLVLVSWTLVLAMALGTVVLGIILITIGGGWWAILTTPLGLILVVVMIYVSRELFRYFDDLNIIDGGSWY